MKSYSKLQRKRKRFRYNDEKYEVRVYTQYFKENVNIQKSRKLGYLLCYSSVNLIALRKLIQIAAINGCIKGKFVRIYDKNELVRLILLEDLSLDKILKTDNVPCEQ